MPGFCKYHHENVFARNNSNFYLFPSYDFAWLGSSKVFSVTSDVGPTVVGCGLYIQASTVNHSCRPNATQSFNGRSLALRCTRPILKGEEITIGITELHKPRAARRHSLRANYFFECRCERCAPEEAAAAEDARLNGYACPTPNCTGVCTNRKSNAAGGYPSKSADEAGDSSGLATDALSDVVDSGVLLCDSCGASRPGEETGREGRAIVELLERGRALAREGRTSQEGKQCLQEACERATRCLHRANWVLSEIYTELSSVCLEAQVRGATVARCWNVLIEVVWQGSMEPPAWSGLGRDPAEAGDEQAERE